MPVPLKDDAINDEQDGTEAVVQDETDDLAEIETDEVDADKTEKEDDVAEKDEPLPGPSNQPSGNHIVIF